MGSAIIHQGLRGRSCGTRASCLPSFPLAARRRGGCRSLSSALGCLVPPVLRSAKWDRSDSSWLGRLHVYVDGVKIGAAPVFRCLQSKVSPGSHSVRIRLWWMKSKPVTIEVNPGDSVRLEGIASVLDPVSVMPCVWELGCGVPNAEIALWLSGSPDLSSNCDNTSQRPRGAPVLTAGTECHHAPIDRH